MRGILWWVPGLALAFVGANLNDPYLLPVRGWSLPALAAAGLAGLALLLRSGAPRTIGRRLLVALWVLAPLAAPAAEGVFQLRKARVLAADGPEVAELGRHVMVGYKHFEEVAVLASRGYIGGILVSRRNLAGRSIEDLREEIGGLQAIRRLSGLPPLRVAADQEGGIVSNLSPWLPPRPALSSLAALPPAKRSAAAYAMGGGHGRDLSAVGVTVNFAPVLDVRDDRPVGPLDLNSLIHQRAISADPAIVGEVATAYARGLAATGVRPTVKHFPGLGRVERDTHHFRTSLPASREDLEATDWRPFRRVLADNPRAMMMVGHVTLTAVDPDRPASHSRRVIQDLIRRDWGYGGLVVTDDLNMSPIYHHGLCRAVTEALNAGVDLLLVAFDGRQFYRVMDCALDAWRRGELDKAALAASRERLDRFR